MKTNSDQLIEQLSAIASESYTTARAFASLDDAGLNQKPSPDAWSILECLEHLNLYAAFYLPELRKAIGRHPAKGTATFKSGLLGNLLVSMIIPKEDGKKRKTFPEMNPAGKPLRRDSVETFLGNHRELQELIVKAGNSNLGKGGIPVTFSRLVKLKLGDTLRFMVYHHQRHVQQAARNLN